MQLVKNTYFTDDESGTTASASGALGVKRKVQEIALALELENSQNSISKKLILQNYLNKLNFGGDRNIRGIEKASEYYFDKSVTDLNYIEAAMLAGVINAPTYYNPFYYLDNANDRKDEVLYQMYNHGYISKLEYHLGLNTRIEDLLADPNANAITKANGDTSNAIPYQAYVDAVVEEVIELTGQDPYSTTMHIYTYMNKGVQKVMDEIQVGAYSDYFEFPDDYFECASICIDNKTGEIIGILGGRNYSTGGQLLLNHATDQYKQTGSSIKPVLAYALAFENLGWATSHIITDKPIFIVGTDFVIKNSDGLYRGDVTLQTALGESLNTCAIQTLEQVISAKGRSYCVDYLNQLGMSQISVDTFTSNYAIGSYNMVASCEQMASSYAMLMNYGTYNEPHTVEKIVFTDGKSPINPTYETKQVLSDAAAYLTTTLMRSNVTNFSNGSSYGVVKDTYPVYAKTGTSTWEDEGEYYGIPAGSRKDSWLCACTSGYSIATWTGYEQAQIGRQSYITENVFYQRIQAKITNLILDATVENCDYKPIEISQPSSVSSITHIIGTFPYAQVISGMDPEFITTGLIKTSDAKLVTLNAEVENLDEDKIKDAEINSGEGTLALTWPKYPDEDALYNVDRTKDISLKNEDGTINTEATGKQVFNPSWIYGSVVYKADVKLTQGDKTIFDDTVKSNDEKKTVYIDFPSGKSVLSITYYYGFNNANINSNKCTISQEVTIEGINVPKSFASYTELTAWIEVKKLISSITVTKCAADDDNPVGTFRLIGSDGGDYAGKSVVFSKNKTFKGQYYDVLYNISLSTPHTIDNNIYTITATTNSSGVKWTTNNPKASIKQSDNSFTVEIDCTALEVDEKVTITAKCADSEKTTASVEITKQASE